MIEIVYTGPAGVHRALHEGEEYPLPYGVPTEVPAELADKLCRREHFEQVETEQFGSDGDEQVSVEQEVDGKPRVGETITYDSDPEGSTPPLPTVDDD